MVKRLDAQQGRPGMRLKVMSGVSETHHDGYRKGGSIRLGLARAHERASPGSNCGPYRSSDYSAGHATDRSPAQCSLGSRARAERQRKRNGDDMNFHCCIPYAKDCAGSVKRQ